MESLEKRIAKKGAQQASEQFTRGLIGHVINYYPESFVDDDQNKTLSPNEWHTADVKVLMGQKEEVLYKVPCFVYSQGIISDGLKPNDRVWVEFINGDKQLPVITAYYREPSGLKIIANSFKYAIANFFQDFIK